MHECTRCKQFRQCMEITMHTSEGSDMFCMCYQCWTGWVIASLQTLSEYPTISAVIFKLLKKFAEPK